MGSYVSKSDIENVFGVDNIAVWSNLAGGTDADTARITLAIGYAENIVEDSFRGGKYALPFNPIPNVVVDWCAKLAGIWLFLCRPLYSRDKESAEGFLNVRDTVFEEIATYNANQRTLNCDISTSLRVDSPVAI